MKAILASSLLALSLAASPSLQTQHHSLPKPLPQRLNLSLQHLLWLNLRGSISILPMLSK